MPDGTSDVARASRPLWRGHPARALMDFNFSFDMPFLLWR